MKQVLITINGPGEISAWLTPLSKALKAREPDTRIVVCLLPCVYSSGAERSVLDRLDTIDAAASVRDSLNLILFRKFPQGVRDDVETLVVRLGGDMVLTSWLARRIGAPAFAYVERPNPVLRRFERVFYNGLNPMPEAIGNIRPELLGEMMVDAATAKRGGLNAPNSNSNVIGVFPGSRTYMAEFVLPYFVPAIDMIAAERPNLRFLMARSDYVTDDWLRDFPAPPEDRDWQAGAVTFHQADEDQWFETDAGTRIDIRPNPDVFQQAKVALTVPGTNTGEMAAAGIPMVTVLPTYRYVAENVPLRGIGGHLGGLPVVGPKLKVLAAKAVLRNRGLLSQANRRAGRVVVPELVGENLHSDIKRDLLALLDDTTGKTAAEIQSIMGKPGSADRFANEILSFLGQKTASAPGAAEA